MLAPLAPGRATRLRAARPGFAAAVAAVTPAAGDGEIAIRFRLEAVRRASGRVIDGDGDPVAGADVALAPSAAHAAEPVRGRSDDAGRFELEEVGPGRFDLMVRARGFAPATVPSIEIVRSRAAPSDGGEPAAIDLGTVSLLPGATVEGRVAEPRGRPLAGAEIRVVEDGERPEGAPPRLPEGRPADAVTDADGRFRLDDLATEQLLTLEVRLAGYVPAALRGVRTGGEPVRVTLEPAGALAGVVVDEEERPVGGARLRLTARGGESDEAPEAPAERRYATAGRDGRFEIRGLAGGRWDLTATAEGYRDAVEEGVEVATGEVPAELRLVLERGVEVSGRVTGADGEPVAAARIVVSGAGGARPASAVPSRRRAATDGDGHYRLGGLDPGPTRFTVEHPEYRRLVREHEVAPGHAGVDFQLRRGGEIVGRVVDSEGRGVAGARVTARPPSEGYSTLDTGRSVATAADGRFRIAGLSEGSYTVGAEKAGYAAAQTERPIALGDGPAAPVELRLTRGVSVAGRVLGLGFDELSRVRIVGLQPQRPTPPAAAEADYEGRYRLPGLRPGDWTVIARVDDGGKTVHESVHLEPGAGEVRLDLDFGGGLTLSGRVVRGAAPVSGAEIQASAETTLSGAWTETDQGGRFLLEGLDPGLYTLEVSAPSGGPAHRRRIELSGDRDLVVELDEATVRGLVVADADGRPIEGAVVSLDARDGGALPRSGPRPSARTDAAGAFTLAGLAPRRYRLQAKSPGYGAATAEVEAVAGAGEPVELRLRPTDGLDLRVVHPGGAPAGEIRVAALDVAGRPVLAGAYPTRGGGWVRLAELPAGSWSLLAATAGSATAARRVTAPGEPVTLVLPEAGSLEVTVPALAGSGRRASLTLRGPTGRPYRAARSSGVQESWELVDGRGLVPLLPAGAWIVVVRTADGAETWSAATRLDPGRRLEVTLE